VNETTYLENRQLILVTIVLCIASLLFVLDYSVSSIILPYVIGDLGARYEQGVYIVTTFSVGNALSIPPLLFAFKYFGERRALFYSLLLFPFASLICGLTNSFNVLLFFRFILGLISGPIMPLALFVLLDLYPKKHHETVFGIWACTVITAPAIGPLIGGYLCTEYTWRIAFLFAIPIGLICALILRYELGLEKETEKPPFDWIGYFFLAVMSTTMQLLIDKGQQWDWYRSNLVLFLFSVFVVSLVLFLVWNFYSDKPVLELSLLRRSNFSLSIVLVILTYGCLFGSIIIIPVWLETMQGYDAFKAGLALAPIGIIPLCVAPFNAVLVEKFGLRPLLFFSMCAFAAVSYYTTNFYVYVDLYHIQMSRLFLGLGFAFYLAPLLALALEGMNDEERPKAMILFSYIRMVAGAVGAGGFATLVTRRSFFHHEFLGEFVNVLNPYYSQYMTATQQLPFYAGAPNAILNGQIEQQARILAIIDVFWVMTWMYVAAIGAILLWSFVDWVLACGWIQGRLRDAQEIKPQST